MREERGGGRETAVTVVTVVTFDRVDHNVDTVESGGAGAQG